MWECGNDGPEMDPTDEVRHAVADIRPRLEDNLGKTLTEVEPLRCRKQISNQCVYYVKILVDGECLHIKIHKDFENRLTLKAVQQRMNLEDPVNYF